MEDKYFVVDGKEKGRYYRYSNAILLEGFINGWYDYIVSVIYKNGNFDYDHRKLFPTSEPHRLKEKSFKKLNLKNPLIEKYNYESVKDYFENGNKNDAELIDYIFKANEEYAKIIEGW